MRADKEIGNDFYEWLSNCPVRWIRNKVTKDHLEYLFYPDDDEVKNE